MNNGKFVLSYILYGASITFTPSIRISSKSSEGKSWYLPAYLHSKDINTCLPVFYFPATNTETYSPSVNPILDRMDWMALIIYSIASFLYLGSWLNLTSVYFFAENLYWAYTTFFYETVSIFVSTEMIWTLFFLHWLLNA